MNVNRYVCASVLATLLALPAYAQTSSTTVAPSTPPAVAAPVPPVTGGTGTTTGPNATVPSGEADPNTFQRNVNQQNRVESGLKDGQLSTGEAAHIEHGEAHIDNMEAHDEKTGMTPQEMQNLQRAQNHESNVIHRDDSNAIHGNPASASSQRMQADVQRDASQQQRIDNGVKGGSLAAGETGKLEHGQARDDHAEAGAGRNGHVSAREQARLQRRENRQSNAIYRKKHNNRVATQNAT